MKLDHLLICGLGSIGRRHLRHFRRLGVHRIDAYRTNKATIEDDPEQRLDHVFHSLDEALAEHPQAVIVANPTSLHLETAKAAVNRGAHLLIEKPISHLLAGCEELLETAAAQEVIIVVGCNLRFHPLLMKLKEMIEARSWGRPLLARSHFGAWLPGWHPWEDYRVSYAARKDLGGGAALTHIHEIDYLIWLFGPSEQTSGVSLTEGPLGTDVDEITAGVVQHNTGTLSSLTLSLCERTPSRTLHVAFERGSATLDLMEGVMVLHESSGRETQHVLDNGFSMDATYARQAESFIEAVATGETDNICTGKEAVAGLRVALEIQGK